MAQFWCSSCHQFFGEPGYCPYDGARLSIPPEAISQPVHAVSAHDDNDNRAAMALFATDAAAIYERLVGQTLDGRYFIERKIGEGGMGVVYAARHAVIERPLAIKVLRREVARDASTIKRFVQEAKAASRIGHPHIIDVTDFGTTPDGLTYQVMEFVDGTTLAQTLKQSSPLPLGRALPIIAQIAQALGAAHAKGIVHRDLKPENIFLTSRDGRRDFVKIVDFGIAKVTPLENAPSDGPRLTRAGAVFGTPEYMAPEQAAGRSDTDARVDVYALGTIFYEMLTGRVPHKSESMVRTLAMQMLDPIEPPSVARPDLAFAPEVEAVVMRALAKKREHRYQTMLEVHEAIQTLATTRGIDLAQPVSASVGGQPAGPMQLQPLPPGAASRPDQATVRDHAASGPPASRPPPPLAPVTAADDLRRQTTRRAVNEPAFVTASPHVTFDHLADDEPAPATRRARWPLAVLAIVLFGGVGVGAALILEQRGAVIEPAPTDAAVAERPGPIDAGAITELPPDAMVITELATDAGVIDAGRTVGVRPGRDASVLAVTRVDAGLGNSPALRGNVSIEVLTRPDGGILYVNQSYRGPSGTHLEEPKGTRATVTCTLPGYEKGKLELVFDGETEVVICRMTRVSPCVPGLKNPFDDCPD